MNELQGEFICPRYKNNGIIWNNYKNYEKGDFKKWLCRKEYIMANFKINGFFMKV